MKITYYSKYSKQGPSSRYRIFQFLDAFRNEGINVEVQILLDDAYFQLLRTPPSFARYARKLSYVAGRFRERKKSLAKEEAPLTVIEQQLFPYIPFNIEQSFLPSRYLMEMDDAIYLTHPRKIPELLRKATGVIVGNQYLANFVQQLNANIHVIPTVLDTDVFRPETKSPREKIRLGWSGLEYNFKYLKILEPVFQQLLKKFPLEIVILSGSPPRDFSVPFLFEKWSPEEEVRQINQFDIGIMPLETDEWCRSKCGMKLLQYMAMEIPAVASPVGVNSDIIQEGENGFTASNTSEWIERLSQLIINQNLRLEIGKAARKTVVKNYSAQIWFPRLLEVYKQYSR